MRLKVIVPVLAIGLLAATFGLWRFLGHRAPGAFEAPPAPVNSPTPQLAAELAPPAKAVPVESATVRSNGAAAPESAAAQHQAYVEERCATLQDLAMDDTPEALASILGELTNRDPEIRKAAVNAAMQFGSRDAIPRLLEAAEQTDDPDEKTGYLEAVKFLKLPSLSELAAQARTNAPTPKP